MDRTTTNALTRSTEIRLVRSRVIYCPLYIILGRAMDRTTTNALTCSWESL